MDESDSNDDVGDAVEDAEEGVLSDDTVGIPENYEVDDVEENVIDLVEESSDHDEADTESDEANEEEVIALPEATVITTTELNAPTDAIIPPAPSYLQDSAPSQENRVTGANEESSLVNNSLTGSAVSQTTHIQYPSVSANHNTSLDDFQSSSLLQPAVSAVSQTTHIQYPSVSGNHNTSLDDFQSSSLLQPAVSGIFGARQSNDSVIEFRSPKRRRTVSPAKCAGKEKEKSPGRDDEDDDYGNFCSICFEPWDNSGRHRLASLKCGHLFGLGCIEKWLKGQGGKCPSCNEKAKMKDIRVIYAKAIKMMDTTERDRALQELDKEKELRRHSELEAAQARLHCQQCMDESRQLREDLERLRRELSLFRSQKGGSVSLSQASQAQPSSQPSQWRFVHEKTVKIWEGGQCRVLAHCPSMAALVISQPSANLLFPGFGIKKLSCLDFKTTSYLTLHQKALRAMSFHPTVNDGVLLSVSMDKTVKLTSIITNNIIQSYSSTHPLWSCEWNPDDQNYFYVGQQNGQVLEFDVRNTAGHLRELNSEGSTAPVVALQYMSRNINAAFKPGGLIVGQLDRVSFFESKPDNENRLHILPLEGNLTSLNVDTNTRHLLASFRPTAKHPSVRHQLCELTSTNTLGGTAISCNGIHTFHGGRSQSVLGKTVLLPHPADDSRLLAVAGDEQSESTHLWDSGTSHLVQSLPCQGVPVDFSSFSQNDVVFLAALTDKCLKVHRWK